MALLDRSLTAKSPLSITVLTHNGKEPADISQLLIDQKHRVTKVRPENLPQPQLFSTDVLLMDIDIARQPKSSQYIRVPTIVVFSNTPDDVLPPWLQADHVFLLETQAHPDDTFEQLNKYLPPRIPNLESQVRKPQHLALLFGITQLLNGQLDLDQLLERILNLPLYLNVDFAALLLREGDSAIFYRSNQPGREELTGPVGNRFARKLLAHGLEGWVLRHMQAVVVSNTHADERWLKAAYLPDQPQSVVALPIELDRVQTQGVFMIGHSQIEHFDSSDLPLLEAITTQVELALENAILYKNQTQRSVQLALINEVSQAATSILNTNVMLSTVVEAIRRRFSFLSVSVYLHDPTKNVVKLQALATASPLWDRPAGHAPPT